MDDHLKKIKNELIDILEDLFPKDKCKERGEALVLFAQMWMAIEKMDKKRKDIGEINIEN